jgi:hypothetical protein
VTPSPDTVSPPITSPTPANFSGEAVVSFNQESWNRWKARGRASDAALAAKVRVFALITGAAVCLAGSFWMFG